MLCQCQSTCFLEFALSTQSFVFHPTACAQLISFNGAKHLKLLQNQCPLSLSKLCASGFSISECFRGSWSPSGAVLGRHRRCPCSYCLPRGMHCHIPPGRCSPEPNALNAPHENNDRNGHNALNALNDYTRNLWIYRCPLFSCVVAWPQLFTWPWPKWS